MVRSLSQAGAPCGAVQVPGPLKFRCCVAVSGFIEEAPADLMAYQGFTGVRASEAQCFLVESRGFMPSVLSLIGVREHEQWPEPVPGVSQQQPSFSDGFLVAAQHGKNPYPFEFRAPVKPVLNHGAVKDNFPEGRWIHAPCLHFALQRHSSPVTHPCLSAAAPRSPWALPGPLRFRCGRYHALMGIDAGLDIWCPCLIGGNWHER